jgi:hypothetical protein
MTLKKAVKATAMLAMMGAMMMSDIPLGGKDTTIHNGSTKSYNPWDKIQLSKAERKGKTYEEIQAMKKAIYDKRIEK